MIQSYVGHLQINVQPQNMPFYKELFAFAGWPTLHEEASLLGVGSSSGLSLWFDSNLKAVSNDHDGPGMNHLGLSVKSQAEVDRMCEYLREHNIPALFETPRHRAEFSAGPDQTYYQVMFESPDCILFEVVYTGPK